MSESLQIAIVQDGPDQDLTSPHPKLTSLAMQNNIGPILKENNAGYGKAVVSAVGLAKTDNIVLAADDDFIQVEAIRRIQTRLSQQSSEFLSTQFRRSDGSLGRNTLGPIREVEASDLAAVANHKPGLIFQVEALQQGPICTLSRLLANQNGAAYVYPQEILLAELLFSGRRCLWWPDTPVVEGHILPSDFADAQRKPYWETESRLDQSIDFLCYLADATRRYSKSEAQRRAVLIATHKASTALEVAIDAHTVDGFPSFVERQVVRRSLMRRLLIATVRDWWSEVLKAQAFGRTL